jgi:hypothetical protein
MIQTKLVIIATTLNTIRYSMLLAHSSKGNEKWTLPFQFHIAMAPAGTGMAPAIAVAAGDRFSFVHGRFSRGGIFQQQLGLYRFVI